MRVLTRGLSFGAALALAAAPWADRPAAAPIRVPAGSAAAIAVANPASMPRFVTFGWVSPPREHASAARYAELAGAGLDLTVLAWGDSGSLADNRDRLAWCAPVGVKCLVVDRRLERFVPADTNTHAIVDTVVADHDAAPALGGWYLGDEPDTDQFALLEGLFARFRRVDPSHPAWNNLRNRSAYATRDAWLAYTREYVARMRPAVLCNALYDFGVNGDRGQLVENVAGLAAVARESGLPFWGIVQLVGHGDRRAATQGLLRYQAAQWLAYGARGIGYFTYWTPAPDTVWNWQPAMIAWTGERTATYDTVRALNVAMRAIGETFAGLQWLATMHTAPEPPGGTAFTPGALIRGVRGRATLGLFADSTGAPWLFVANRDSASARAIELTLGGARLARFVADDGVWRDLGVTQRGDSTVAVLMLAPGGFTLLALSGTLDGVVAGRGGPSLALAPNPARAEVRMSARDVSLGGRVELLDLAGRRVWSRALPPGASAVAWRGAREGGARAGAGVYFARIEDARGVAVRRLAWLGAP